MKNWIALWVLVGSMSAQIASPPKVVTPVAGESWLNHLHRPYEESSMGKTWRLASSSMPGQASGLSDFAGPSSRIVTLRGADLYRLNCQGCHGAEGRGAPPEIASLIDPIRATSLTLVDQRMKSTGMALSRKEEMEMVRQSQAALLKRLHQGGESMPAFPHLRDDEVRSLLAYLRQLAGVPGAESQQFAVTESADRVGELVVKSTCHICHDATGENPSPEQFAQGRIPPLSQLSLRVTQAQLVQKVTHGALAPMNLSDTAFRGRMPVFEHIRATEAAAVYGYLLRYPPSEDAGASMEAARDGRYDDRHAKLQAASHNFIPTANRNASQEDDMSSRTAVYGALGVLLLIAIACWFTIRELGRLHAQSRRGARQNFSAIDLPPMTAAPITNSDYVERTA